MARFIDKVVEDKEVLGYYILAICVAANGNEMSAQMVQDHYDAIFGEKEESELEEISKEITEQVEFAKSVVNLLKMQAELEAQVSQYFSEDD